MDKEIIIMQGPPASGKSTKAQEIYNSNKLKYVIVNRDSIRESRGDYWIPEQENYITKLEVNAVRSALELNLVPIIDATNLNPKTLEMWENIAEEFNAVIKRIELYIPFKEALLRDTRRGLEGGRSVGEKVLRNFYQRYYLDKYEQEIRANTQLSSEPDDNLPPAVIFDLDLTIMVRTNRGPYEYDKADSDKKDPKALWMIKRWIADGITPIFITGREATEASLKAIQTCLGIEPIKKLSESYFPYLILGRKEGDRRPSLIVKQELYEQNVEGKYNVLMAFDDDSTTVNMYKQKGIFASKV